MAQRDLKTATIKFLDGAGTPEELTVKIGEGNITWSVKRNVEYVLDRGNLDITREGDQVPCEVSIDAVYEEMTASSGGIPTIEDVLNAVGEASAWVSTGAACEPYAVDITIEWDVTCGTVEDEILTFSEFRYESIDVDARAGTLAISGKCNVVRPTAVRTTL